MVCLVVVSRRTNQTFEYVFDTTSGTGEDVDKDNADGDDDEEGGETRKTRKVSSLFVLPDIC